MIDALRVEVPREALENLNIADPPDGADPQKSAGFRPVSTTPIVRLVRRPTGAVIRPVGMTSRDPDPTARDAAPIGRSPSGSASRRPVTARKNEAPTATVPTPNPAVHGCARTTAVPGALIGSAM